MAAPLQRRTLWVEGVVLLLDGFGDPVVPLPIELTGEVPGS